MPVSLSGEAGWPTQNQKGKKMNTVKNVIEEIKGNFKIIVRGLAAVAACLLIGVETCEAQGLPGGPLGGGVGGFTSQGSNVVSYVDYTGTNTVYSTNLVTGFTNLIQASTTAVVTSNLWSIWFPGTNNANGVGVTNAAWVGGTNQGIIAVPLSRFIAFTWGGTLLSNGVPFVNSTVITNTLTFARTARGNPNQIQFETTPGIVCGNIDTVANGTGIVVDYTNVEDDACGYLQLISWKLQATTNANYSITNPYVYWRLTGNQQ